MGWVMALGGCFTAPLPQEARREYLECVRERVEVYLRETGGQLAVGVYGLRFRAHLTA